MQMGNWEYCHSEYQRREKAERKAREGFMGEGVRLLMAAPLGLLMVNTFRLGCWPLLSFAVISTVDW